MPASDDEARDERFIETFTLVGVASGRSLMIRFFSLPAIYDKWEVGALLLAPNALVRLSIN